MEPEAPGIARPPSAARFRLNAIAMVGGLAVLWFLRGWNAERPLLSALIAGAAIVAVIIAGEQRRWRDAGRCAEGLSSQALRAADARRIAVRMVGLLLTLAPIAATYWLHPEYRNPFYRPSWTYLGAVGVFSVAAAPFYFTWMDRRLFAPEDIYWQIGACCLGLLPSSRVDREQLRVHVTGWAVKAFFLPLMVGYLANESITLYATFRTVNLGTMGIFRRLYEASYVIDLLFCVIGYTLSLRLFDSHIRSTDPTIAGWLATLVCYHPLYTFLDAYFLHYEDGLYWNTWLAGYPVVQAFWAAAIIALVAVYGLCTVAFGLRFSNLTHRGIITDGPYRFCKHPAYLAKNLSWWLLSVPFVSPQGGWVALHNCVLLAVINGIYFLRAATEERHLARDPAYVAYAAWIGRYGLWANLRRIFTRPRALQ